MLLKEYALDPAILCSRTNCQILLPQIGASQGRLIARFPKDWKKRAYEAARKSAKPTELSWIEERLRRLGVSSLFARGRVADDPSRPWLENALIEHHREHFSAILSREPQQGVLTVDDLDDQIEPWKSTRQCEVPRQAIHMADVIQLMFMSGKQYKLIDRYLDPSTPNFRRTLFEFLRRIADRPNGSQDIHVECHVATSGNNQEEAKFANNFEKTVTPNIPRGLTVSLHFFPITQEHDRFVLTEWCGAFFGQGLGEGEDPPEVKVLLLEEHLRLTLWHEFPGDHPALVLPKP